MFLPWLLTIIVQAVRSSSNCSTIMTFFVRQCLLHIMCAIYIAQNHRVKHIVCNMFFLPFNSSCLWIKHHLPFFTIYLSKKEKKRKRKRRRKLFYVEKHLSWVKELTSKNEDLDQERIIKGEVLQRCFKDLDS